MSCRVASAHGALGTRATQPDRRPDVRPVTIAWLADGVAIAVPAPCRRATIATQPAAGGTLPSSKPR